MEERELKEIGEFVFSNVLKYKDIPRSFDGNYDKLYLRNDLIFFFNSKIVVDFRYNTVWKFKQFKKHIENLIDEEYELHKDLIKRKNDLIDSNEYTDGNQAWLESSKEDSEARIENGKRLLKRLELDVSKLKPISIEEIKKIPFTNYLEFDRSGFCRCPFHNEKTPSMKYYPDSNTVHCFGACSKSYDIIDYIMLRDNCSFKEAINKLK
jgi:hypothetical protein